jgi:hypothetical protein
VTLGDVLGCSLGFGVSGITHRLKVRYLVLT